MSDGREENGSRSEKDRRVRTFRIAALVALVGLGGASLFTGLWNEGMLGLAGASALLLYGIGERIRGADRAIALVLMIVGGIWTVGHLLELLVWP